MTLLQMTYLLEIDRCGSMNKAAQNLFVSQSTLSSAMAEVEKELGITVFRRSNRGTALTDEGRELAGQIAPIVESSRRVSRYYARRYAQERVRLSVATQRYPFCAEAFVEFLHRLEQPSVQASLKEMDMAAVIGEVATRQSDMGVLFVSDMTEQFIRRTLDERGLSFTPLVTCRPHVFMRRGHPLSGEASLTVEQLRPYPYAVFTQSDSNLCYAEEAVALTGADFERVVYVSDRATIYNVMAHTDCFSTGSGVLPPGYGGEGLICVPLRGQSDMRLGYIHLRRQPLTATEQMFVDILRAVTAEMTK